MRLPPTATPRGVAFSFGGMFIGAALVVLASLAISVAPAPQRIAGAVIASLGIFLGTVFLRAGGRLPRWSVHALLVASVVMVTVGVRVAVDDVSAVGFTLLYVLAVANAFSACSWVGASVHLLVVAGGVVVGLSRLGPPGPAVTVSTMGVLVLVSLLLGRLVRVAAAVEVDALTGLLNRRGLERSMEDELARSSRTGQPLALAVVDLDHFKQVNDVQGHAAGDRLLRHVALAWSSVLPTRAVLARWGGDEFVLLVPGAVGADAVQVVDDLRSVMPPGRSCSAGVASIEPGESASMLMSRADGALYAAKRQRRGTTRVAASVAHSSPSSPPEESQSVPAAASTSARRSVVRSSPSPLPASTGEPPSASAAQASQP